MTSRRRSRAFGFEAMLLAVMLGVSPAASAAGQSADQKTASGQAVSARAALGTRITTNGFVAAILGSAWNHDNSPIPFARLRLRNLVTARIDAVTIANEEGQFEFQSVEPGSYVIELVSENRKVLTVGHTFSLESGETVATFVRLGSQVPWFAGFFGNAALAVSAAAAAAGLTALAPEQVRPVSGRQ